MQIKIIERVLNRNGKFDFTIHRQNNYRLKVLENHFCENQVFDFSMYFYITQIYMIHDIYGVCFPKILKKDMFKL